MKLLSGLFKELTLINIETVTRPGSTTPLLAEASLLQTRRNEVVHRAEEVGEVDAIWGVAVTAGVFLHILTQLLSALDLEVHEGLVTRAGRT